MSFSEDLQDLPLPALFQRAQAILKQLDSHTASDPSAPALVGQGAAVLRHAAHAVDTLGLFSPNEDKDDLSTGDIKYLLIPFYQAELLGRTPAADPSARLAALASAAGYYKAFLHSCRQYGLLSPPAAALAEAVLQQDGADGGGSSSRGGAADPATLRHNKIEKFKREKYIKGRLETMAMQQQQARGGGGAADEGDEAGGGDGEEAERELWMLQADLAALQAAERMGTLQQEVEILRHAAAMPEDQRQRQRQQREQAGAPPELLRQLQAAAGNLTGPAVQRQRLAAGVFRPGHALPTMSVEQFGELEYHRMMEQQQQEAAAKERQELRQAERRAEDVEEEEVQKQRAWDEFKDDNPKGWGNSKLRPCA